jgi:hypothetical protein
MFEEILPKNAKESLALIGENGLSKNAYLAGGTALALQFGHRESVDFDFFTARAFNEDTTIQRLNKLLPDFYLERKEWRTILGYVGKTRFSYFFYEYPLLFKTKNWNRVHLADPRDIAAMKIAALADRGTKRDFIDLYFIFAVEKIITLDVALRFYDKKFKKLKQNKLHIIKSLSYFDDAESEKMPRMFKPVNWVKVKDFFVKEQKRIANEMLTS